MLLNPLEVVEDAIRDLIRNLPTTPAPDELRRLIGQQVDAWNTDARRGRHHCAIADPERLTTACLNNLIGYGPLTEPLNDPDVWEIMINSPHDIFLRRHHGPSGYHTETFHDDAHVERTLTRLLDDNSHSHRKLDPTEGLQDAQLANGARIHIAHPDLTRGGHLVVNIRKFTGTSITQLQHLTTNNTLTPPAATFLAHTVAANATHVVAGHPGSGKTTLLGCLTSQLDPTKRVVIAEEVFETDIPLANVAHLQTRPNRPDRPEITLRHLVAAFLRMAPDIAVVGECRDREALPLLLTLSSGVTGFTTIHAASARQALTRLRFICQLADTSSELPLSALNALISDTIDVVVHCRRVGGRPQVDEIVAVEELTGPSDSAHFTTTLVFSRTSGDAPLVWTGEIPARLSDRCRREGVDLPELLRTGSPP